MSQCDYPAIIRQLQEQLAAQQAQIQALLERGVVAEREGGVKTSNIDVVKTQLFNGTTSKISGFIMGCKLYIKNKLAGVTV